MDLIAEYWWLIVAALVVLALLLLVFRPRQRVTLSSETPVRPHMVDTKAPPPSEGRGLVGEAAAATGDVTGEILRAPVHAALSAGESDDLQRLKGVGPRLAEALNGLGFTRFEQIAGLSPTEVERLDPHLGAFRGRIARDRIVEQADYLARNDLDGFEQKFGKL